MVCIGEDQMYTAMAKSEGYPLQIGNFVNTEWWNKQLRTTANL
jgi:hypothetical protein